MSNKLKKFQVEELEQRFETGRWISEIKVGVEYEGASVHGTWDV